MAASATFALKVAVWFRRGRLFMVSPDSLGTACPLSGRNSTYRSVQISETSSITDKALLADPFHHLSAVGVGLFDTPHRAQGDTVGAVGGLSAVFNELGLEAVEGIVL